MMLEVEDYKEKNFLCVKMQQLCTLFMSYVVQHSVYIYKGNQLTSQSSSLN